MNDVKQQNSLDPTLLIIFGITGDLAKKKLLPALYSLAKADALPEHFEIIGVTRQKFSVDEWLASIELCVNEKDGVCDPIPMAKLKKYLRVFQIDLTNGADYAHLLEELNTREAEHGVHMNRLYYLSIPPQVFSPVVRLLGENGHNSSCPHGAASTRLLVEKPFGYDMASAKELIADINQAYGDFQVYRIDHYLAKETVQNILTFRFNNPLFESVWSGQHISHIMVSAVESIGIENRVTFYEQTGAVRDLIQSHLLQLLAITTMEPPKTMESKDIHSAKLALLESIKPLAPDRLHEDVVLGQYDSYKTEVSNPTSNVETYAAMKLSIDNPRWQDVPIFVRTGKVLNKKATTITVVFDSQPATELANRLTFHIQPDEGISVQLQAKKPGLANEMRSVDMKFNYNDSFDGTQPEAYQRVLLDAIRGDKTLFSTSEEVLASWRVIEPLIQDGLKPDHLVHSYPVGSEGPTAAQDLLGSAGSYWT